jgi:hypothetical protein
MRIYKVLFSRVYNFETKKEKESATTPDDSMTVAAPTGEEAIEKVRKSVLAETGEDEDGTKWTVKGFILDGLSFVTKTDL